ncbi:hypothetical protein [Homoserinimonas sp. OAct 916]|uniref:hypothetical protein n=1 Tax=Homoserinimonas sp. OAct 916 TaxID=2211450 RepID=UPI000DBE0CCC|nr:hypothetical protein [Homoserinimonas sp. OAct 916]
MEHTPPGNTASSSGMVNPTGHMPEDRYPDGVVFRVWLTFGRAIIYGAGLGVLAVAVLLVISIVQDGWTQWLAATLTFVFFGALAGAVVGTVAATGSLIAVLIFAPVGARPISREGREDVLPRLREEHTGTPHVHHDGASGLARRRARAAGVGAAVLVCFGWIFFLRGTWVSPSVAMVLVPAVVGAAVAGVLAWIAVRRSERIRPL